MRDAVITKDNLGQSVEDLVRSTAEQGKGDVVVHAEPDAVLPLCQSLRDNPGLNYNLLSDITAVDWYGQDPRFELVYRIYSVPDNRRIWVKTRVDTGQSIESVEPVWKNANWLEREVYDLFGVKFDNHPDLRRLLMPPPWIGHPYRKDFPIGSEEVQFTPNENDVIPQSDFYNESFEGMDFRGWVENGDIINTEYGARKMARYAEEGKMVINMGPQHPSTHGVLRVIAALEGETIIDSDLDIGYVHTGIEKQGEQLMWQQTLTLTDRMDYVVPLMCNLAYVLPVEKLLGIEVPPKAKYVRVILNELTRISSHLIWLGTHALELGAMTMLLYGFSDREKILDVFELCSGQRMMTSYINIGGIRDDIPEGFFASVKDFIDYFPGRLADYHALLTNNPIWLERTKGIGYLSLKDALNYGVTGPLLRATGLEWDVRKAWPYSGYEEFDFDIPTGENSDVYDRYMVRMEEMRQSLRIVEQALAKVTPGPYRIEDYKIVLPPRQRIDVSMESLIHHFLVSTRGFDVPEGDAYVSTEGPRGETGYYIVSDGGAKPYRMHMRAASLSTLQAVPLMSKGMLIADMIALLGSIDMVMGEVDR